MNGRTTEEDSSSSEKGDQRPGGWTMPKST